MVGIRVVESENWRKEENATKPKKLGKNFLVKSTDSLDVAGSGRSIHGRIPERNRAQQEQNAL